ncbi:MAG: hypothetical protein M1834_006362 [Cirrosporium novae-zelandiae]|nr:MAG: hypothetical protein M1834_006362 [Cirrosporium novae-zelandiae]
MASNSRDDDKPTVSYTENADQFNHSEWKVSRTGDGDTAMALFSRPDDLEEFNDPQEIKKLERKIDFMILPYLAVCYAFFYIDKTTLSYAAIFGIRKDLHMHGTQYNWLSNMFRGFFLMLQAACGSFTTLAILRALGGAAEACADPSFMLITSMWYTRRQQPIRIGLWYTANGGGIALGGLLGYGIGHIKGALPSWKYEFILIGASCCIWGIIMFIMLPDSPVTAKLLTHKQRRIAVERLKDNQTGVENKHFKLYQIREVFLDYKSYLFFLLGLVGNIPNGGTSNFGTIIIKGFGFSTLVTTLMQIPYGILIAISILTCVFLNDRFTNKRCIFVLIFLIPNIAGLFGLRYVPMDQKVGRLICYYLIGPEQASFVMILSLTTANTAGHTKKVVTNALLFLG